MEINRELLDTIKASVLTERMVASRFAYTYLSSPSVERTDTQLVDAFCEMCMVEHALTELIGGAQ